MEVLEAGGSTNHVVQFRMTGTVAVVAAVTGRVSSSSRDWTPAVVIGRGGQGKGASGSGESEGNRQGALGGRGRKTL